MKRAKRSALLAAALGVLVGSCGGAPETQSPPAPAPQDSPSRQATPPGTTLTLGLIARPVRGTVSPGDLRAWGLPDDSGLLVAHVHLAGPAMKAGLKDGDVIHTLDGESLDAVASFEAALQRYAAGDLVALGCWRGGAPHEAQARLEPAMEVYQRACDGADAEGCLSLGSMLAERQDVDRNAARAVAFIKKGCDIGSAEACVRLGNAHQEGDLGLQQNVLLAASLFEKACERDAPSGCLALAGVYATPGGSLESQEQAAVLYQRGCGWRVAEACHEIAVRYETGTGVPQDAQRAQSLHRVACDLGSQDSCGAVDSGQP